MTKMKNMQAWCTDKLLIIYNTSIAYTAENSDKTKTFLIIRDYASRTTRKQIAIWLREFADLNPNESDYILAIIREQRLRDYRLLKESLERYYIFDLSQEPFDENAIAYSWTTKEDMTSEKIWRHILSFSTPTI